MRLAYVGMCIRGQAQCAVCVCSMTAPVGRVHALVNAVTHPLCFLSCAASPDVSGHLMLRLVPCVCGCAPRHTKL